MRAGNRAERLQCEGSVTTLELPRGPVSLPLDNDLRADFAWMRHVPAIYRALREFRPDVVHVTGPSDCGIIGARLARWLGIPIAASWHTNLHEYAATRSRWLLDVLPQRQSDLGATWVEAIALWIACRFYRRARVLFAPNPGLCQLLERRTRRPCHLMQRGVDTELFTPGRRERDAGDRDIVLGFVGRLSVEKNIALLGRVQQELSLRGIRNFRFRIVGQGKEEPWLRQHLPGAEFTGVLQGEVLARAYAGMDVFIFPSHTDTFGNAVLEAMASGVPAVVTPDGGPASIVHHGRTGLVAEDAGFTAAILSLLGHPEWHREMRANARACAKTASWDAVFDKVYTAYSAVLPAGSAKAT